MESLSHETYMARMVKNRVFKARGHPNTYSPLASPGRRQGRPTRMLGKRRMSQPETWGNEKLVVLSVCMGDLVPLRGPNMLLGYWRVTHLNKNLRALITPEGLQGPGFGVEVTSLKHILERNQPGHRQAGEARGLCRTRRS